MGIKDPACPQQACLPIVLRWTEEGPTKASCPWQNPPSHGPYLRSDPSRPLPQLTSSCHSGHGQSSHPQASTVLWNFLPSTLPCPRSPECPLHFPALAETWLSWKLLPAHSPLEWGPFSLPPRPRGACSLEPPRSSQARPAQIPL
jgi:hypothetical protein